VQHYASRAHGRAFGPLNLVQTLAFCRNLSKAVAESADKGLELCTAPGKEEDHTNATVLVGAYLILCSKYTSQGVAEVMGSADAQRKFVCSWASVAKPEGARFMSVMDCWTGLEMAKQQGWLTDDILGDDVKHNVWVTNFKFMLEAYDATWLVPGVLMVSADPSTTAHDPNPATCSGVFPVSTPGKKSEYSCGSLSTACSRRPSKDPAKDPEGLRIVDVDEPALATAELLYASPQRLDAPAISAVSEDARRSESEDSAEACTPPGVVSAADDDPSVDDEICSTDTVAKVYSGIPTCYLAKPPENEGSPKPFVWFLQDCQVSIVVRANFANEPGMLQAYDGSEMLNYDIVHQDICVDDHCGGLPDKSAFKAFLEVTEDYMRAGDDAVLVHCKGGFGRSVVMACALLIDRFDLRGSALLGWVRLCRAGTVTTPKQEQFLRSLRGREDLRRFLRGMPGTLPAAHCGCSVQ
jgi:hypothetical protein